MRGESERRGDECGVEDFMGEKGESVRWIEEEERRET